MADEATIAPKAKTEIHPKPGPTSPEPAKAPTAPQMPPPKKEKPVEPATPPAGTVARFEKEMDIAILERTPQGDEWSFTVKPERLLEAARYLKEILGFEHLASLTAVDYLDPEVAKANYPPGASPPEGPPRIEVVYNFYGYGHGERLALRVKLERENPIAPSVALLWTGADWLEREVYDLFGVKFHGHPNMKRLLLPEGWTGYPMRKDYDRTKEQFVNLDPETGEDTVSFEEGKGW